MTFVVFKNIFEDCNDKKTISREKLRKQFGRLHVMFIVPAKVQSTKFSLPSGGILVINAYFQCDPRTDNFDDTELICLLAFMKSLLNSSPQNVVLAADLNCHFEGHSRFTNIVKGELEELQLIILFQNPDH